MIARERERSIGEQPAELAYGGSKVKRYLVKMSAVQVDLDLVELRSREYMYRYVGFLTTTRGWWLLLVVVVVVA